MEEAQFEISSPILTLRFIEPTPEFYVARLIAADMQAEVSVSHYGGDYLDHFLAGLARDWRGWRGERAWASLEGTLALRASIASAGEVTLAVSLNERHSTWATIGDVRVENGRLDGIARAANAFCRLLGAAT